MTRNGIGRARSDLGFSEFFLEFDDFPRVVHAEKIALVEPLEALLV